MDLCRANERNAAALTLTSIGQQNEQEIVTSTSPSVGSSSAAGAGLEGSARMRSTAGTTWLLVDSNNAEHAATTVVAQQESGQHPEPNNNVSVVGSSSGPVHLGESWANKQPTVLEDGSIVYADVVSHGSDGLVSQSM